MTAKKRRATAASIPAMCQKIIDIEADGRADYKRTMKKLPVRRVPAAIASRALKHPDFDALDPRTRGGRWSGAIPTWVIEGAIAAIQQKGMVEKRREGGATVLLVHDKAPPPNEQDAAIIKRLQKRLQVAQAFAATTSDLHAREKALERRSDKRSDRAFALELKISRLRSKTPSDLMAKVTLYQVDPARFTDSPAAGGSLVESIMRDIPSIISKVASGPDRKTTRR